MSVCLTRPFPVQPLHPSDPLGFKVVIKETAWGTGHPGLPHVFSALQEVVDHISDLVEGEAGVVKSSQVNVRIIVRLHL